MSLDKGRGESAAPTAERQEKAHSSFLRVTVVAGRSSVADRGISRPSTLQRTYAS